MCYDLAEANSDSVVSRSYLGSILTVIEFLFLFLLITGKVLSFTIYLADYTQPSKFDDDQIDIPVAPKPFVSLKGFNSFPVSVK